MAKQEKNAELAKAYDALCAQRDAVLKLTRPLEVEAEKLRAEADKAEAAWRKVRERIVKIETDGELADVSMQIAALARALGARSIKAS